MQRIQLCEEGVTGGIGRLDCTTFMLIDIAVVRFLSEGSLLMLWRRSGQLLREEAEEQCGTTLWVVLSCMHVHLCSMSTQG